ncbi:MAG: nitrilase-related carbon-nitrogen hydrolase [Nitrospirota bacterium]
MVLLIVRMRLGLGEEYQEVNVLKVAGIQMACSEDRDANLKRISEMTRMAVSNGAKIIAFQEMFYMRWFSYNKDKENFKLAETIDGYVVKFMRELAFDTKAILICPIFEKDNGCYYNTALVIDEKGEVSGRYRKIHIPDIPLWEERYYFAHGDKGFPVFETPYCKIGIQICWDNFFPEGARILALKGAEIIFSPTASAFASHYRWERMICANAIANNIFIFRINRVGKEEHQEFYGKSFCVNPYGELIVEPVWSKDAIVFADIDIKEINETRQIWNFFEDRMPQEYKELTD